MVQNMNAIKIMLMKKQAGLAASPLTGVGPGSVVPLRKRRFHRLKRRGYELRWSFSWTWVLPVAIVVFSLYMTKTNYENLVHLKQALLAEGNKELAQTINVPPFPDFATGLRHDLEQFFPLFAVLPMAELLAREWRTGRIVQLALRRPLRYVLLERLGYVCFYLLFYLFVSTWISVSMTQTLPGHLDLWQWEWQSLQIVGPPVLFLLALCLLVANVTVSAVAGYVAALGAWLINIAVVQLISASDKKSDGLCYALNGWTQCMQARHPDSWPTGKLVFFLLALALLLLQIPLLRYEARFIRTTEE